MLTKWNLQVEDVWSFALFMFFLETNLKAYLSPFYLFRKDAKIWWLILSWETLTGYMN